MTETSSKREPLWLTFLEFLPLVFLAVTVIPADVSPPYSFAVGPYNPNGGLRFAWGALCLAFVGLYVLHKRRSLKTPLIFWLGAQLIGFAMFAINVQAGVFFVFACGASSAFEPRWGRWAALASPVLSCWLAAHLAPSSLGVDFHVVAFVQMLVTALIGLPLGLAGIVRQEQSELGVLVGGQQLEIERLAKAVERQRIARDMHDLLGQALTAIALKAELLGRQVARDPELARNEASQIAVLARSTLEDVRMSIFGVKSRVLTDELHNAKNVLDAAGISLVLELNAPIAFAPEIENALGFILREAVTNVVRHSAAQAVRLEMHAGADRCELMVADNGRGYSGSVGQGVRGMRQRIDELGGSLRFERRSVGGGQDIWTVLAAEIPLGFSKQKEST